jgi:hypothetical protein
MINSKPFLVTTRILFLFVFIFAVSISCDDQVDVNQKKSPTDVQSSNSKNSTARTASTCGGFYSGTYSTINSYYTYPLKTVDVSCAASGATVTVSVNANDIPNRFTVRDASNNVIAGSGWLGYATYSGPWGSSLSNSGSTTFSFTKSASTYYLQVETLTPPNYSYSPQSDAWDANVSCTCQPTCTTPCGGSFNGSYNVISSYYTYPLKNFDVSCARGNTITVSVTALDIPNRFTIRDASNNYIAGSGWLGSATYSGPWGMNLNNSGSTTFTFTKSASTYYLQVETLTPPNYSYSPSSDFWSSNITCP